MSKQKQKKEGFENQRKELKKLTLHLLCFSKINFSKSSLFRILGDLWPLFGNLKIHN